jgi:NarL family two-component system sensor histidine kinase LiaS
MGYTENDTTAGYVKLSSITDMKFLKYVRLSFRRLQWKLTLSYTGITLGVLLISLVILAALTLPAIFIPYDMAPNEMWVQAANEQTVPLARMLLSQSPLSMEGIADLVNYSDDARFESLDLVGVGNVTLFIRATAGLEILIFDHHGALLGRTGYPALTGPNQDFDPSTVPKLDDPLRAALSGVQDADLLVSPGDQGEAWVVAVPVFDSGGGNDRLLGAVAYVLKSMPTENEIISHTVKLIIGGIILFLSTAGLIGTIFGAVIARGMARRLQQVSDVTDAWSQGDFSEFIVDPGGDEISQLADRLNHMAEQLQQFFKRSQEMAVSEERNRLARDLHDSAKQEALAASFHLGTALTLFDRDPQSAKNHLIEGENLVDSVRSELTDLIHELRPPSMNGDNFDDTINEYLIEWAHQAGIKATMKVSGSKDLSLDIKQAIYRIMQEALANVTRHSGAEQVIVALQYGEPCVELLIEDDGIGFDTRQHYDGIGLESMRERAELFGADFSLSSATGQGTRIAVVFPIDGKKE